MRRCFSSENFDLTVWYHLKNDVVSFEKQKLMGFQLSYRAHKLNTNQEYIFEYKKDLTGQITYYLGKLSKTFSEESAENFPGRYSIDETLERPSKSLLIKFSEIKASLPKEISELISQHLSLKASINCYL